MHLVAGQTAVLSVCGTLGKGIVLKSTQQLSQLFGFKPNGRPSQGAGRFIDF